MLGRVPPQAVDLEEAVIGALLLESKVYSEIEGKLTPEDFYIESNEVIFRVIEELHSQNRKVDLLIVVEALKDKGLLEKVGGAYYITKCTNCVVSTANTDEHCKIIKQRSIRRQLIKIAGQYIGYCYNDEEDAFELVNSLENDLKRIATSGEELPMAHISSVMIESTKKIEEFKQSPDGVTGVPTDIGILDNILHGWQPTYFIVIGARPAVGKTAFALTIAKGAASYGKHVAIHSLEMKSLYLGLRMIAASALVNFDDIMDGSVNEDQELRIRGAVNKLEKLPIYFDESSRITFSSIKRKARQLKSKGKLDLLIVDYLQLVNSDNKKTREQQIAEISRGFKELSMELNIPIIALSQLSREMTKNVTWDKGPEVNALRESGAIEQDADVVMMLWGATDEEISQDPSLQGKRKCGIRKHRNGVLAEIELSFAGEYQHFGYVEDNVIPKIGNNKSYYKALPQGTINHFDDEGIQHF